MEFKKSYTPRQGFTRLSTIGESTMKMLSFGMIELAPGEEIIFDTGETEAAFVILSGRCTVEYDQICWEDLGQRRSVFEGSATSFYVGRRKQVRITGVWNVKIAVAQSPVQEDTEGFVVRPEQVRAVHLGQPTWERDTHFIFDDTTPTKRFCIGEVFMTPGNWAGFPPHKHDVDHMPEEGILEEIYFFLFQPEKGFGFQRTYTKDGEFDETYLVETNDLVEFPRGYHTTVSAPGYNGYFLWVMAGEHKGFFRANDPDHEWVAAVENLLKKRHEK